MDTSSHDRENTELAETIAEARTRARLSQRALAAEVGVSQETVRRWKIGEVIPRVEYIDPLAAAMGLDPGDLAALRAKVDRERETTTERLQRLEDGLAAVTELQRSQYELVRQALELLQRLAGRDDD